MPKVIDSQNDDTVMPETAYKDGHKPMPARSSSRSVWIVAAVACMVIGTGLFIGLSRGSHTDPAPYAQTNGSRAR